MLSYQLRACTGLSTGSLSYSLNRRSNQILEVTSAISPISVAPQNPDGSASLRPREHLFPQTPSRTRASQRALRAAPLRIDHPERPEPELAS